MNKIIIRVIEIKLNKYFFIKMGLSNRLFLVFLSKHHYNFTTNIYKTLSIQYTLPEFEPTNFGP